MAAEKEEQHSGECNHYSPGLLFSREPKQQQTEQENFQAQGDREKKSGDNFLEQKHSFCNSADSGLRTSLSYHYFTLSRASIRIADGLGSAAFGRNRRPAFDC